MQRGVGLPTILKQGVPAAVGTSATLLMAPVGRSASTDFKVLSPSRDNLTGKIGENAVCVPLHGNGIALRVTSDIILSKRVLQGTLLMLKARRHDMIFHYREGRAVRASAPGGLTLRACNQHFINSSPSRTQEFTAVGLK